jgi:hypothetical protein
MSEHTDRHFDALQKAVCAWLRANGIDPIDTPRESGATITDAHLTLRQWVRHPQNGNVMKDPDRANEVMTRTITVPVIVPPPPLVEEWLAPRCPTCGR